MPLIQFRPLHIDDSPLLHTWLNQPHMRRFYQVQPITLEDVIAKYTPRIQGREPSFSHIVLLSDVPIGKMQCYRNIDWPHYAADIHLHDGVSIDYFIGEPSALGKSYGSLMVSTYPQECVFRLFLDESQCYVCQYTGNTLLRSCGLSFCSRCHRKRHSKQIIPFAETLTNKPTYSFPQKSGLNFLWLSPPFL